jgi:hypothetical protein
MSSSKQKAWMRVRVEWSACRPLTILAATAAIAFFKSNRRACGRQWRIPRTGNKIHIRFHHRLVGDRRAATALLSGAIDDRGCRSIKNGLSLARDLRRAIEMGRVEIFFTRKFQKVLIKKLRSMN